MKEKKNRPISESIMYIPEKIRANQFVAANSKDERLIDIMNKVRVEESINAEDGFRMIITYIKKKYPVLPWGVEKGLEVQIKDIKRSNKNV